ncbi:hypothetical protein LWI29_034995 [Acer saccharum]|uniref:Transcription factor TFIIB cyclin-like domain-containing protein n=1 Tax=Acer saccharum TaxID=4024 RepID=A0AA39VPH7_ACESA|nr:hypothetical protein LWI29_014114 [Acer saccharum]KAK0588145.1 hypothetical protein LWI29_034995 [Acer saccharum]
MLGVRSRSGVDESADKDPARVGGPYNPLLTHGGLTTVVSGGSGELMSGSVGKSQSRSSNPDKYLIQAFSAISAMSDRRSPISVAAAVIYIITQLSNDTKPLKDISIVTRLAKGTIKNSYKDLHPHLSRIIPDWFANEEDIKSLRI